MITGTWQVYMRLTVQRCAESGLRNLDLCNISSLPVIYYLGDSYELFGGGCGEGFFIKLAEMCTCICAG